MSKDLCNINIIGKDLFLIDKLVKMYVLKIFITVYFCHFGLASYNENA